MAKVKVRREGNLLWEDECQPLTNEQMNDIKSQFHPSNTANVNMISYHIYDTDEHIVGEWRETIDGVKKKKPVYERTITKANAPAGNIGSIPNIERLITLYGACTTGGFYKRALPWADSDGNTMNVYENNNDIKLGLTGAFVSSQPVTNLTVNLQYTKTTDEWTPI